MMFVNPNDVSDFDIHAFLSDDDISELTSDREFTEEDALFWDCLRRA